MEFKTYEALAQANELEQACARLAKLVKNEEAVKRFEASRREHPNWKNRSKKC